MSPTTTSHEAPVRFLRLAFEGVGCQVGIEHDVGQRGAQFMRDPIDERHPLGRELLHPPSPYDPAIPSQPSAAENAAAEASTGQRQLMIARSKCQHESRRAVQSVEADRASALVTGLLEWRLQDL